MPNTAALPVAVLGSTGYTGAELLRLLVGHPYAALCYVGGRSRIGEKVGDVHPQLGPTVGLPIGALDPEAIAQCAQVVFCALPHAASMEIVKACRARGLVVFDLSADFRLRDPAVYARWYGPHSAPELLEEAAYGLPELFPEAIPKSDLIAVPGCYPTATLLALSPLIRAKLLDSQNLVGDAESGVSGAGRSPSPATHYPEVSEGIRAYNVGGAHRHIPEILQGLRRISPTPVSMTFTPHLVPMSRGMLVTVYAKALDASMTGAACRDAALAFYAHAPFVHVLEGDQYPDTLWSRGTNRALLSYTVDPSTGWVIAQCAIDNLVKGASGQAIQCMNLRFGWAETTGLESTAVWP